MTKDISLLESFFDNVGVGVMVEDRNGNVIYVNSSQLRRSHFTYRDYMTMNVRDLYEKKVIDVCIFEEVLKSKHQIVRIQKSRHGQNVRYEKLVMGTPVFDSSGNVEYVVNTYIDLDEFRSRYAQALAAGEISVESDNVPPLFQNNIVCVSETMQKLLNVAYSVAETESSVLLCGESGTGKEVLANYIHVHSRRGDKEMVVVNCASLPESLLEAELFGYEKGAFTGASYEKQGLIELADKGTLFLDEINSIPLALQGKLLRVLETKKLKRIGSLKEKQIDFRLLSAANENLRQCIERKAFRADLYYRLSVVPLVIPPLRCRRDDIVPLCQHFLRIYGEKYGKTRIFSEDVFDSLRAYHWPGNVRELKNLVERLVVTSSHASTRITAISPEMFDEYLFTQGENAPIPLPLPEKAYSDDIMSLVEALKRHNGARRGAAKELGISLRTLQYRLKKHRITVKPASQVFIEDKSL